MAVVPGVLLDEVHQDPAHRHRPVASGGTARSSGSESRAASAKAVSAFHAARDSATIRASGAGKPKSLPFPSGPRYSCGAGAPARQARSRNRSTSLRCRTRPSRDSPEGGTARVPSSAAVSPAHLSTRVRRWWPRNHVRVSRSLPRAGGSVRGSGAGTARSAADMGTSLWPNARLRDNARGGLEGIQRTGVNKTSSGTIMRKGGPVSTRKTGPPCSVRCPGGATRRWRPARFRPRRCLPERR